MSHRALPTPAEGLNEPGSTNETSPSPPRAGRQAGEPDPGIQLWWPNSEIEHSMPGLCCMQPTLQHAGTGAMVERARMACDLTTPETLPRYSCGSVASSLHFMAALCAALVASWPRNAPQLVTRMRHSL